MFPALTRGAMLGEKGAVMTTLEDVATKKGIEQSAEQKAAVELVRLAQEQGLSLTGPDGLLKQLTKMVLETALNEEMTEHLGYEKHDPPEEGSANIRNGTRTKTVLTDTTGPVELDVPRDRASTFEPQIVKKRQRRLSGVDEVVLSLYAKGLTTGEISAHFAEIYGASVSKETISRITDRVIEEMNDWSVRPLDETYAAVFIDAIVVKVRDGQVANRPFYAAIGVTLAGERDILGLWAGTGGEGAKFWMSVLTDLRNRGVKDTFFVVCDGLKGLLEVVGNVWPQAIVQTCIIHLLRNTFRLTSRKYWDEIKRDVKPIYTAVNATAARAAFDELTEKWGQRYPAVIRLWDNAWDEFIPFLDYDVEIRRVICSTNAIESLNARYRRAIKARGHFPSEQAALKCLYLVTRSLDPTGAGRARWTMRWKPALNAFAITFADRFPAAETY
ncbi:transposase, Mutator family protein [Mycolicibacterium smegmatis MKD8]|uniref:Mutator family transposase n=2 Tax=Mycolicibacterium TaxID=1866885 RepID=A0A2U9PIG3_MYCSE|nr:transposase, Mutator family protein [Mycolicibacterium smegmatis MKD8]